MTLEAEEAQFAKMADWLQERCRKNGTRLCEGEQLDAIARCKITDIAVINDYNENKRNNKRSNRLLNERLITMKQRRQKANETKIYVLSALVMVGVFFAFIIMGIEREIERENQQRQAWIEQGYPIGE